MNLNSLMALLGLDGGPSSFKGIVLEIFGGDYPVDPLKLHQIAARAVVVFLAGLAIVRLGKSRLIGRVTALDVIVGVTLGSLLGRGITGHASISGTAVATATIVFTHWLFTLLACRWHDFGTVIKGQASLLVRNGRIDDGAMLQSHISLNDLMEAVRLKGLETIEEVHHAYKERNGEISVVEKKRTPRIIEVAVAEGVQIVRIEIH